MSLFDNEQAGQAMIELYRERYEQHRLLGLAARLVRHPDKSRPPSVDDILEDAITEGGINEDSATELDEQVLGTLGKRLLEAHFAVKRHESTMAEAASALVKAQAIDNLFRMFVDEQVGKVVTVRQVNETAKPHIGVYVPKLNPGYRLSALLQEGNRTHLTRELLQRTEPETYLREATGVLNPVTAARTDLVLDIMPGGNASETREGFIISDVVNPLTGDPLVTVSFT